MTVNVERVTLWVEALESGEFTQARGGIRLPVSESDETDGFTYCCLGVATEVALRNGLDAARDIWGQGVLAEEVQAWYGFGDNDPWVDTTELLTGVRASIANDEREWSFARIAAGIRKMYLEPRP